MAEETPAIPGLNRRMLLRGGLAAGAGLAVAGLATVGLAGVAEAVTYSTQNGWAYCNACAGLWFTGNNTNGACTATEQSGADNGHVKHPSFSYQLRYNVSGTGGPPCQPGWNWCHKCQCLFYTKSSNYGACPAGDFAGPHAPGGLAYSVLYNDYVSGSTQQSWTWCANCQLLFDGDEGGPCAFDGGQGAHISGSYIPSIASLAYDVSYYSTGSP